MIHVAYKKKSAVGILDINLDLVDKLNTFYSETYPSYNSISLKEKKVQKLDVFLLCESLFKSLEIKSFKSYRLFKSKEGKPFLESLDKKNQKYFISITHSKTQVAVALSKDFDIGIDVESSDRFLSHRAYKKWLHSNELDCLEQFTAKDLAELWTKKESLTKATGLGYDLVFKKLDLSLYIGSTACFTAFVYGADTYKFVTKLNTSDASIFSLCFKSNDELFDESKTIDWRAF